MNKLAVTTEEPARNYRDVSGRPPKKSAEDVEFEKKIKEMVRALVPLKTEIQSLEIELWRHLAMYKNNKRAH